MSAPSRAVLADALRAEIGEATLQAAVFTTFALEWRFLLDEVLPVFVPHGLSGNPLRRREEMAEHFLATGAEMTVYTDHRGLRDTTGASRIPLAVVPIKHPTGFFHPKVVLALVDDGDAQRLVVAVASANLTKQSWWEWVECAHVWSIGDAARTWSRDALLAFLGYLHGHSTTAAARAATERIRGFLMGTAQRHRRSGGAGDAGERFLWNGAAGRPAFVDQVARDVSGYYIDGTLEVVSPWYSDTGHQQVQQLADRCAPGAVVVLAPLDADGHALVPPAAVDALPDIASWGTLPSDVLRSGPAPDARPRHVHAKVYRFISPRERWETVVVGSFNLTGQAFGAAGNVEAAVLVEMPEASQRPSPWLKHVGTLPPLSDRPATDDETPDSAPVLSPLRLSYDWASGVAEAGWDGDAPPSVAVRHGALLVLQLAGEFRGRLPSSAASALRSHLESASPVLEVDAGDGADAYAVVTELNVVRKPSAQITRGLADAIADLLLDDEGRRERDRQRRPEDPDDVDDLGAPVDDHDGSRTIFDGFAALYQGLEGAGRELTRLAEEGRASEVEYRLRGEGSRCLGNLLTTAERGSEKDPTLPLVVCWAVEDLMLTLRHDLAAHQSAAREVRDRVRRLREHLEQRLVTVAADPEMPRFLTWARQAFLRSAS